MTRPDWWLFSFLRRLSVFFFIMALFSLSLYILGSYQKYLDRIQYQLLDMVHRFTYLTFGFGLFHYLLSLFFPKKNQITGLQSWGFITVLILAFVLFLLVNMIRALLTLGKGNL